MYLKLVYKSTIAYFDLGNLLKLRKKRAGISDFGALLSCPVHFFF